MINFYLFSSRHRWWKKLAMILFIAYIASPLKAQVLVWEENFDGTSINPETWTFDFGDGSERGIPGWGNQELQYYTSRQENARIENGSLVIEALRENFGGKEFTSARLKTIGRVQFQYGTLEARIKVPNLENGLWPAFWMLGATGNWPASGEIDIMEMGNASGIQGNVVNKRVGAAAHWENNDSYAGYGEYYNAPDDLNNDFHLYKMTWDSQFIRAYVDDVLFYTIDISGAAASDLEEFHKQHYILLNLAVGGSYTGILNAAGITAPLPARMEIDYIKLYQNEGDNLFLGSENALSGNFGIYTESANMSNRLVYGEDAELYIWNNLAAISNATPYEGNEVLALQAAASQWFGFGVENKPINLLNYADGFLKFHFKTAYSGQFKIGVKSGHGESWINYGPGQEQFGLVRDGEWHEVSIPLSTFNNPNMGMHIDLGSITQSFMFAGDPAGAGADFYIDNIYYSGGVASNPTPIVSITSPVNDAVLNANEAIVITANATDENGTISKVDFYNGNTLMGTSTTSPYSFTWNNVPNGVYNLTARATDNEGAVGTSGAVRIYVSAEDNLAPTISITSPEEGASFIQPATITLNADASDTDGSVYKVDFYNGTTLIGTDFTSPYSFNWTGVLAGDYTIVAKVTDNGKLEATSDPVNITVVDNKIVADKYGIFTDQADIPSKITLGVDAQLYIWNNLKAIEGATPYEGSNVLAFTSNPSEWFGMGFANDARNLEHFANGSLKLHMKISDQALFKIGMVTSNGDSWINFEGQNEFGLVRDGEWSEVTIPLSAFPNADFSNVTQAFMIASDLGLSSAGELYIDNIYYSIGEPTSSEFCGTAENGDYSYIAKTEGENVTYTFHPLGEVAGGDLAIVYIREGAAGGYPGYGMVKNSEGDFTFTKAIADGVETSFYFTYQVGAGGGERNSAANPHSYTVGTECGSVGNVAPVVSLTSPANNTVFNTAASITINATASDADGEITKVEFYEGNNLLGTDESSPYSFVWENAGVGSYSITAKAYDNGNKSTTSSAIAISVSDETTGPGNYCGTAANGDFAFSATTANDMVNITFHPLGPIAGSNLAIMYVKPVSQEGGYPGYTMNATGTDFTYSIPAPADGTELSIYFTYRVGENGPERNSSDDKLAYVVGTTCSSEDPEPDQYCGTAANGDFAFTATTANSMVNVTFHSLAPIAGSDFVILHIKAASEDGWPGYLMAPSGIDFTYSIPAPENGVELKIYFTYRISAQGAERNSFEDQKSYITGTSCGQADCETVFYADADGDGFGNPDITITACEAPEGYTDQGGDCNDDDASINPDATDLCDGIDRNCDGIMLEEMEAPEIMVTLSSSEYTGGDGKTIYLGYGPTSVTLSATTTAEATYTWTLEGETISNQASTLFKPTAEGMYTFTVTAMNEDGCTESASEMIQVIDIRGGKKGNHIVLCLRGQTIMVNKNAIKVQLDNGATLGSCETSQASNLKGVGLDEKSLSVYPNPAGGEANINFHLSSGEIYQLAIYNLAGALVKTISSGTASREGTFNNRVNFQDITQGVYVIKLSSDYKTATLRLVIQK